MKFSLMLVLSIMLALSGCGLSSDDEAVYTQPETPVYQVLTPQQAKDMIDMDADVIILDVRTESEFREMRIPGAVLLPDSMIAEMAEDVLPDKGAVILVYCRSGLRSANATHELIGMGYFNVFDFGGILDWPFETE